MQNFTFGRKGLNWFLFAFILFVGSSSSFGQCYTVNDEDGATFENEQTYCYLDTIQDLINDGVTDSDGNTAIFESADTVNDTDPLDENELLTDGETYYVGSTSDDSCTRVAVEVTVNSADTPTNTVTNSEDGFTVTPCESSNFSGNDLLGLFEAAPAGYSLKIYNDQFGDSEIVDYNADLTDGNSYFVGFAPNDPSTNCPSERVAVGIDVVDSPAPTADSPQVFCEGATVGDLLASSDSENFQAFRWYRTATSSTPLADDVVLIDGEDYFVSQIVNERGSIFPPCESDRTEVIVEVISFDAGGPVNSEICRDDLQDLIDSGASVPTILSMFIDPPRPGLFEDNSVTFSPSLGSVVNDFQTGDNLLEFTGTFTTPEGCSDNVDFTITVNPSYNAGDDNTENNTVCRNAFSEIATEEEVTNYLMTLVDPDADMGGTFSNVSSITSDINDGLEGPFTSTYTVGEGEPCEDTADLEFSIDDFIDLGEQFGDGIYCQSEIDDRIESTAPQTLARQLFLEQLDPSLDIPTDGTFSKDNLAVVVSQYDRGFRSFKTTYTVNSGGCTASIDLKITIVEEAPANAGSFNPIEDVCSDEDPIDLSSLINNDPDASTGGTFSGDGVTDNEFDPSIGDGIYTITYTVDDSTPCTTGTDSTTFDISVINGPLNTSIERSLCVTEARDLISDPIEGYNYIQGLLLESGVDAINPDNFSDDAPDEAARLSDFIETPTEDFQTFMFEYINPGPATCDDETINISITINDLRDAEAGDLDGMTFTECSNNGMIDLNSYLDGTTTSTGGTFTGTGVTDNMFDTSLGSNDTGYEITYEVDETGDCVTPGTTATAIFTINVEDSFSITADTNREQVCEDDVTGLFPNSTAVRNFYLNMLSDDAPTNGTFNPTIAQLINRYNTVTKIGDFTTEYTVTDGACSASVELTIEITETEPAVIGDITDPDPICRNAGDVDLFSFLPDEANPNGTFEGYADGMFSPGMEGAGTFDITYTLTDDSPCTEGTATATFTITVTESAYAGMDMDLSVCMDAGDQDLFTFLSADADTTGEFTYDGDVITDGIMDPSAFAAGEYEITYTVPEINDCGPDTATFTITVEDAPGAPAVAGNPFTFCATEMATVADLAATGTNLTYYSDADLTTMVAAEDALVSGSYYVTQRNDDGACESAATEITVTINDADTPTISNTTQEFCEYDDATIADLTAAVNETGTITWYDSTDGDNALNAGTALQDGTVYYATLFNVDTGCESSVRLAVTVNITDCPLLFPEGFSPNGDGINDTFDIENIEDEYPNYTIEIYNRWGDSVYKGNANTPDWDGYSSDSSLGDDVLPVGVYFYYLNFNDGSTEPRRGKVYLSR